MNTLYTWITLILMALVAYGIYAYVRSSFNVEPQRKPVENKNQEPKQNIAKQKFKKKSIDEEFAEETHFPRWNEQTSEVPQSYNIDTLVLMVRDPNCLYAYWEISGAKRAEITQKYGLTDHDQPVLRVYDVLEIEEVTNAQSYYDIDINGYANNWYIKVNGPNRTYCVDYGYNVHGKFITILRSNYVNTPRANVSENIDEQWPPINELYPHNNYSYFGSSEQKFKQ